MPPEKLQRVGVQADIGIQENQDVTRRGPCSQIARVSGTPAQSGGKNRAAQLRGDCRRAIGRSIVNHNAFNGRQLRMMQRMQTIRQTLLSIKHGNYDGDAKWAVRRRSIAQSDEVYLKWPQRRG
jgi:hypothetical protein